MLRSVGIQKSAGYAIAKHPAQPDTRHQRRRVLVSYHAEAQGSSFILYDASVLRKSSGNRRRGVLYKETTLLKNNGR